MRTIYFIRHGEPDYSQIKKNDPYFLTISSPLSDNGINQAKELRNFIANFTNNIKILVSPYSRSLETAIYACQERNFITEINLHEWLPATHTFLTANEFNIRDKYFKDKVQNTDYETEKEMVERMQSVLSKYPNEDLIIFSHSRIICSYLKSIGINKKYMNYCEIVKVEFA